ncbi:conserved hypothetical protein [Candidatus Magnetomoraceae bacterium gMMP-15]
MKKQISNIEQNENDEMRKEYDFKNMKGGVRGKYYKAYRTGHTVKIHEANGTSTEYHFKPEDDEMIVLEPDIRKYFPNSEAVNNALRCLIPLLSKKYLVQT